MDILFLTSDLMEAARGQKPLRCRKWHEGVNLLKKVFNESCSATSKTPYRIQSDLSYDLRVERYSMPPCPSHFRHAYSDLQGLYETM